MGAASGDGETPPHYLPVLLQQSILCRPPLAPHSAVYGFCSMLGTGRSIVSEMGYWADFVNQRDGNFII